MYYLHENAKIRQNEERHFVLYVNIYEYTIYA